LTSVNHDETQKYKLDNCTHEGPMFHCQIQRRIEWCFKGSVQGPVLFSISLNNLEDR